MQKLVLTPEEIAELTLHWPELDGQKLSRLSRMRKRPRKFRVNIEDHDGYVMAVPPIVLADGYILNGKHRACIAAVRGTRLEAYSISGLSDLRNGVPTECYGEKGLKGCEDAYLNRDVYRRICEVRGIRNVAELVLANRHLFVENPPNYLTSLKSTR